MEGKTPTEKVHNLSNLVATVREQISNLKIAVTDLDGEHSQTSQALGELKITVVRLEEQLSELQRWKKELGDLRTDMAILKRNVEKLEQSKEEWSRRIWATAGPIIGAAVGWLLANLSHR